MEAARMNHEDPYIKAVHDFFNSREWLENLESFVKGNCTVFELENDEGKNEDIGLESKYNHGHHDIFLEFQEWVLLLLNGLFEDLGIDESQFEVMCEKVIDENRREGHVLDHVLQHLQSLTDFNTFANMMREECERSRHELLLNQKLDMHEWDLQVTLATSLLHADEEGHLMERDKKLLPWSRAVLALNEIMEKSNIVDRWEIDLSEEESEIGRLSDALKIERMKVEVVIAQRMRENNEALSKTISKFPVDLVNKNINEELKGQDQERSVILTKLMDHHGKLKMALSQHRVNIRKTPSLLTNSEYEELYLLLRKEMKGGVGFSINDIKELRLKIKRLGRSKYENRVIEDICNLIWLENRVSDAHKDILRQFESPEPIKELGEALNDVEFENVKPENVGDIEEKTSSEYQHSKIEESVQNVAEESRTPDSLRIVVDNSNFEFEKSETENQVVQDNKLESISAFADTLDSSPISTGKARTPTEAREMMNKMEQELRRIINGQEIENVKLKIGKEIENSPHHIPSKEERVKKIEELGRSLAELRALWYSEEGKSFEYSINTNTQPASKRSTVPGDVISEQKESEIVEETDSDVTYFSDATEEDAFDSAETLNKATKDGDNRRPTVMLKEAESLRRQLFLYGGNPHSSSGSYPVSPGKRGVVLNSPKGSSGFFKTSKDKPNQNGSSFNKRGMAQVSVNPSSLRFLAAHVNSNISN